LCCALELAEAGAEVELIDRSAGLGDQCCSWFAGGMLAPWCEGESAHPLVVRLGAQAIAWWGKRDVGLVQQGSLVIAQARDQGELSRFSRRTDNHVSLDSNAIATLEPDLGGRFSQALYFKEEAHLNPRLALASLLGALEKLGVTPRYGCGVEDYSGRPDRVVDCRGLAARDALHDLRGVKGEMLILRSSEFVIHRPIRLLHPRIPLYVVPRGEGLYMVGATMIESDDRRRITARSMIELLQGAYALHPALAEAEVIETGCDVRPAFADNLPRIRQHGNTFYVNGLYRHGYLLAPALAQWTRDVVLRGAHFPEVMDENSMQRSAG